MGALSLVEMLRILLRIAPEVTHPSVSSDVTTAVSQYNSTLLGQQQIQKYRE